MLAPTPPMGWSSWNAFRVDITEQKVLDSAQVIVDSGLAKAGYRNINVDDGWWLKRRTSDGRLLVNVVVGGDAGDLAADGTFLSHDERYEHAREFLHVWTRLLAGEEVVLRPVTGLDALGQLGFLGVVAAVANPRLGVVAAGAGQHIDVAGDVVQAVARIAGAAHHFDAVQLHGENHVHERHIAVVAVARNAVDQKLYGIHFAFTVKATEGNFP